MAVRVIIMRVEAPEDAPLEDMVEHFLAGHGIYVTDDEGEDD